LVDGLTSALEGIQARGKANVGEKTMVNVWYPFVTTLCTTHDLNRSVLAAHEAALASRELVATKGRAAYLGERSRGTCDPGSVSSAILFIELAAALGQEVSFSTWLTQVS
jgi:dihydroxyacetone kinase-like protein